MIKWFKSLFKKLEIEKEVFKDCDYCKGLGFHTGTNSDYQAAKYWCECKRIDGKFPAECYTIDVRWDTSCHTIVRHIEENFSYKRDLPDPKTVFEPYIKLYLHDGLGIKDRRLYRKNIITEYGEKKVYWVDLDSFHDEKNYSDLKPVIRNERLKELGI